MERTATWSKIGTDVKQATNLEQVLSTAHLDYHVSTQPVFTELMGSKIMIPDKRITTIDGTTKILGVVSDGYEVCQNSEAFDFVNCLSDNVTFVKAGMTKSGMVYIIAELPEVKILGDGFKPHIIFSNSFNGGYAVRAAICPLRIVCQNQFAMSFKNTDNSVSIKHTASMQSKMQTARRVLTASAEYMQNMSEVAEQYATVKMTKDQFEKVINKMFPEKENMSNVLAERRENKIAEIIAKYNEYDNSNFTGTLWGAVNAMTDYITHSNPIRKTKNADEGKFMMVTFNTEFLSKFIAIAQAA